ncbi:DNA/RNA polymerase [Pleomassaria siparia CBS 279.74]|uniref:DNA/RNA polymerase n=1 Tax=Pleomassaria siparia CBS 279.74 TaxID=1314801 RepID=A0A6G1K7S9_9PLEO|nr:DNA/RNA polymerase [Pleomassaria siparia CBS 279.74]
MDTCTDYRDKDTHTPEYNRDVADDRRRILARTRLRRQQTSIIIHFDCFYAAVLENETPKLRNLPLAVQQKQIVVTCNYEARRRGLYKLQPIKEAKRVCPEAVIVLGEDLTRFREASKKNYSFLASFSWNSKAERLGFDEVFMDVSDMIEYNVGLLNHNHLTNSFFCLARNDPTAGFAYDASRVAGHTYPPDLAPPDLAPPDLVIDSPVQSDERLRLHLTLASHLAKHLRQQLEAQNGYTCTVGISTNKLLSKLAGNLHKPDDQTTLWPPYTADDSERDNVTSFIDGHEVGKIPGIGFNIAQKLRAHVLQREAEIDAGLVHGGTKEGVLAGHVRKHPDMGPETLERILGGPGVSHGIGGKIWRLLNGCDDTEVGLARHVPKQISLEDSYLRLDTMEQVLKELRMLAESLLKRMHADLLEDNEEEEEEEEEEEHGEDIVAVRHVTAVTPTDTIGKRWLAYPKTIRLSTRPRPPQTIDGSTRNRSFARISKSAPMPNFVFSLKDDVGEISARLVSESLVPLFRRLHPEKSRWDLSLVNVAATNMVDAASEKSRGVGRDISKMFKRQDHVLKQWRVDDYESKISAMEINQVETRGHHGRQTILLREHSIRGSEDFPTSSQESSLRNDAKWESEHEDDDDDDDDNGGHAMVGDDKFVCELCGAAMPIYAMATHSRFHKHERG